MKKRGWWATLAGPGCAHNTERGMTLVEVLIALGILSAVAVVFLAAMSTSTKAVIVGQEQVSAEGLAKSQMESIQQQAYRADGLYTKLSQIPAGYAIPQPTVVRLDPQQDHTGNDQGLQKIIVTITHGGKTVFTLEGYKCKIGQ
jgi:prepilin-type N-terminal cleavage/methylation domain-containing protein